MLLRSAGLGMAVYGAGAASSAEAVEAAINDAVGQHKVLISVFVDGGWDSLSVLAPFGSDHKHEAALAALRPGLSGAVPRSGATAFAADTSLSWHPSADGLRQLWDDPTVGLAVAPAVGYSGPNYSHFTSRHFWEVGALDSGGLTGWMGRYLDRVGRVNVPVQGLTLGHSLSPTMATAKVPVASVTNVADYKHYYQMAQGAMVDKANARLATLSATASGDSQRDFARLVSGSSLRLQTDLLPVASTASTTAAYPTESSDFVTQLKNAAKVLGTTVAGQSLPVRCMALQAHGNFDTHSGQNIHFSKNLKITCDGIRAFWADLKARGQDDRVVMLVWSEFGRRPQENGSAGCDHGAAGMALVLGKTVKQGLIGEFPGLKAYGTTGAGLMQDGNLRATSDFRGIYSALLEQWMGTDAEGIIPGAGLKPGAGAFSRPVLF